MDLFLEIQEGGNTAQRLLILTIKLISKKKIKLLNGFILFNIPLALSKILICRMQEMVITLETIKSNPLVL